jgi:hypothetical protein
MIAPFQPAPIVVITLGQRHDSKRVGFSVQALSKYRICNCLFNDQSRGSDNRLDTPASHQSGGVLKIPWKIELIYNAAKQQCCKFDS